MLNMDPLHIAWTQADVKAVQGEVGFKQKNLGALECIFINVPQIKFVPMLNMDPLHIAWTPADVQAVQRGVGWEQESLGALECIFH